MLTLRARLPPCRRGDGSDPLVASVERHQGAVRGLEFNPSVANLLASGAGESEVYITDLSNPSAPSVYSPGAKSNAPPSDISCVAWNRKVQHILASTSHGGLSVVWDLKLKKPVISFADPNNKTQRNSVVAWNPETVCRRRQPRLRQRQPRWQPPSRIALSCLPASARTRRPRRPPATTAVHRAPPGRFAFVNAIGSERCAEDSQSLSEWRPPTQRRRPLRARECPIVQRPRHARAHARFADRRFQAVPLVASADARPPFPLRPWQATEVLVASEDDRSPVVQIWDLRNAMMPVRELHGHTKGILSASWCPNDANLLLSSGKDNRTIVWDPHTSEMLCELPASSRWTFDVQWSPRIPAILSSSSFDGTVAVYSLSDTTSVPTPASAEGFGYGQAQQPRIGRAPKWLKRPCGATFGFGGQLALFNQASGGTVSQVPVVTDQVLVGRSQQLEAALEGGTDGLAGFCGAKAAQPQASARDAAEWRLMQVLCSSEQRRLLLGFLGLAEEPPPEAATPLTPGAAATPASGAAAGAGDEDPAALFSQLAVATEEKEAMTPAGATGTPAAPPLDEATTLSRALLSGNLEAAVACCLRAGRMADALVLAASGGPDLWTATRDQYLASSSSPFMHTMAAIVHQDFSKFVAESELSSWKETLGLVNTYSTAEELGGLCNQLGERLEAELGDAAAATLCYMCAANIAKVTSLWEQHHTGGADATAALMDLIEKLVVFQEAAQNKQGYAIVADKVVRFAELLAAQGCLHPAMKYLMQLPMDDATSPAAVLMDRLYHREPGLLTGPPPTPFEHVEVNQSPQPQYEQQQQQQQQQYQDMCRQPPSREPLAARLTPPGCPVARMSHSGSGSGPGQPARGPWR